MVTAVKFTISDHPQPIDPLLKNCIGKYSAYTDSFYVFRQENYIENLVFVLPEINILKMLELTANDSCWKSYKIFPQSPIISINT